MSEYIARPREVIKTRIADRDIAIDYGRFFGDQHDPHRAKMTTESILRQVTHGQTVKSEYSNTLGPQAVANYEVPATIAIGYALESLEGNVPLSGKTLNKAIKDNGSQRSIEKSSALVITALRNNGKRLVIERGQDGQTHQRFIYWVPEAQAQSWIMAEREHIKPRKR